MKPSPTGGLRDAKPNMVCRDCLWAFYEFARLNPIKCSIRYSLAEVFDRVEELKLIYRERGALKDG